jgi:hypothetical protein
VTDNRFRLVAGCASALGGVVGLVWGIALVVPTGSTAYDASRSTSSSSGSVVETVIFVAVSTVFFAVVVGAVASLICLAIRRLRIGRLQRKEFRPNVRQTESVEGARDPPRRLAG